MHFDGSLEFLGACGSWECERPLNLKLLFGVHFPTLGLSFFLYLLLMPVGELLKIFVILCVIPCLRLCFAPLSN